MTAKVLASWLLVVVSAAAQDLQKRTRTAELNGGLHAEVVSLARNIQGARPALSASIKITNTGTTNYVYLVFIGTPAAVDDNGVHFDFKNLDGAAYCNFGPPERCAGLPDGRTFYPLRGYTEIDPGKSITVILTLGTLDHTSTGENISLTGQYAYRIVSDRNGDVELSDAERLRHVQLGNFSFEKLALKP